MQGFGLQDIQHVLMFHIAGVRYRIESNNGIWAKNLERYDRSFFDDPPWEKPFLDVTLRIHDGSMPETKHMECLTRRDTPWTLFRQGSSYCMVFRHPFYNRVFWTAVFDGYGRHADIFIHDHVQEYPWPPSSHHLDQLILAFALAPHEGALVHGAGVGISGKGMVFTGHSGAGKSTLARLFSQCTSAQVLSDERVAVRKIAHEFRVYGTPWRSDCDITHNADFPLNAVIHLHHGQDNKIRRCTTANAVKQILPQVMIPWYDRDIIPKLFDVCEKITEAVPVYDFFFTPGEDAIKTVLTFAENL